MGRVAVVGDGAVARGVQPDLPPLELAEEALQAAGRASAGGRKDLAHALVEVVHLVLQVGRQHLADLVDGPEALDDGVAADVAGQAVLGRELVAGLDDGGELAPAQRLAVIGCQRRGRIGRQHGHAEAGNGCLRLAQHPASPADALHQLVAVAQRRRP